MSSTSHTLIKLLVTEFYRRQAGFFLFIFIVFFGIVSPSLQLAYHYALIKGMFKAPALMALVGLAWLGYAWRAHRFVAEMLSGPDCLFLYRLRALPPGKVYRLFVRIQLLLILPVSTYAFIVAAVGWHLHAAAEAVGVLGYVSLLIFLGASAYVRRLRLPDMELRAATGRNGFRVIPYWVILLRFLGNEKKILLSGIKLFSCALLYLLLRIQTPADYDLRIPCLAFGLALFGHGILLFRCREFEARCLLGYRALPVPFMRRFVQIALICGFLLLPEMLMLGWLIPNPIRAQDALSLWFLGFSLLLLLYCLLHAAMVPVGAYLKLCLVLLGILYVGVLGNFLIVVSGFFLVTALVLFKCG